MSNILNHRNQLQKTLAAVSQGSLTVGFIGGSITDGRPRHNWPEPVISWLVENFLGCRISVENAAIGATGSELAVFRAERDLLARGCDLVFVEFAVNDNEVPTDKRMRSREGLLRKLLAAQGCDVVLVYTYKQEMYDAMSKGQVPESIAEFELLAEHYGISSVWMGLYAFEEIKKGRMRWEEWLPDGLHPTSRGSLSYAQSVITFLEKELKPDAVQRKITQQVTLPTPLHPKNWQNAAKLSFSEVTLKGPWTLRRCTDLIWIDQLLETAAIGAGLSFSFEGRALVLGFDFGKTSAEFKYQLDNRDWLTVERERFDWMTDSGIYWVTTIADDLELSQHHFELEVIHGNRPDCTGTNFRLALIGIIG